MIIMGNKSLRQTACYPSIFNGKDYNRFCHYQLTEYRLKNWIFLIRLQPKLNLIRMLGMPFYMNALKPLWGLKPPVAYACWQLTFWEDSYPTVITISGEFYLSCSSNIYFPSCSFGQDHITFLVRS